MSELIVTEGIAGVWHYHLSDKKTYTRGLCYAVTMQTTISVEDFGKPFGEHFPKKPTWCAKCRDLTEATAQAASATN